APARWVAVAPPFVSWWRGEIVAKSEREKETKQERDPRERDCEREELATPLCAAVLSPSTIACRSPPSHDRTVEQREDTRWWFVTMILSPLLSPSSAPSRRSIAIAGVVLFCHLHSLLLLCRHET
ncbi:hypothetical protein PIB30_087022, partial [Stylosanthes scabra]|nr:hypothetical protein [Stylosanthes scabra]